MKALVIVLVTAFLAACAPSQSGSVYSRGEARQEISVRMGVVESVRPVTLEGTRSGVGTLAGGAIGGIAGSEIGRGKGSAIGAIVGAVAGGVAGSALEEGTSRKPGVEITVRLSSGQYIAVTQEADEAFRPGDRVRVMGSGFNTRVAH